MTLVLDASALVAYLANDEGARAVARLIGDDDEIPWTLPLVDAEVGHALRGMVLRRRTSPTRARLALERLAAMPLRRTGVTSHLQQAWALRDNLSFYDALYVSLAAKIDAPLVTLDRRLAAAPKLPARVIVPG